MKITLVRTGGVAGMRREVEIDTDDLEPVRARELDLVLPGGRDVVKRYVDGHSYLPA